MTSPGSELDYPTLIDRLELLAEVHGTVRSAMGVRRLTASFGSYTVSRWAESSSLFVTLQPSNVERRILSWNNNTKQITDREPLFLRGVLEELRRILILDELADV